MRKKIGLFWLRDDFRIKKNPGLYEATKNHDQVVVFYLYKESSFQNQEAQKWWLSQSLLNFRKKLNNLNIELEIIKTESFKFFFDKLIIKKDFSIYWNKVYEPEYLKFDEYLLNNFTKKNILFKIFKGNTLNEINEVKKNDGTPFKVFTPYWKNAEKYFFEKIPSKNNIIKKCTKKTHFFKSSINHDEILPKKAWFQNFEKLWTPSEEEALRELKSFTKNRIIEY